MTYRMTYKTSLNCHDILPWHITAMTYRHDTSTWHHVWTGMTYTTPFSKSWNTHMTYRHDIWYVMVICHDGFGICHGALCHGNPPYMSWRAKVLWCNTYVSPWNWVIWFLQTIITTVEALIEAECLLTQRGACVLTEGAWGHTQIPCRW